MQYKISNLTYTSIRVFIENKEYIIPGRNDLIENFITVDTINEDVKNLAIKGLLKYKQLK
jgi:hypothetical protein